MAIKYFGDAFDDLAWWFADVPSITFGRKPEWYDPHKFTLTPKKEYREELIKKQEQEIVDIKTRLTEAEEKLKALKSG